MTTTLAPQPTMAAGDLAIGQKTDVHGVLTRFSARTYAGGKWFTGLVENGSTTVRIVGWNEAFLQLGSMLQEGGSYRFFAVTPRRGRDGPEVTIFKDTRIDTCQNVVLPTASGSLAEIAAAGLRRADVTKAIVFSIGAPIVNLKGETTLRLSLVDVSDHIMDVIVVDDAMADISRDDSTKLKLCIGDIVSCSGRLSERGVLFVSIPIVKHVDDKHLTSWFQSNDEQLSKRRRVDSLSTLASVVDAPMGSSGTFTVIVKACSMAPLVLQDGCLKLALTVVDSTMTQIDVSYFGVPEGVSFAVGSCVTFTGKISPYHDRSLTTRSLSSPGEMDEEAMRLRQWWANVEQDATFTCLSSTITSQD